MLTKSSGGVTLAHGGHLLRYNRGTFVGIPSSIPANGFIVYHTFPDLDLKQQIA